MRVDGQACWDGFMSTLVEIQGFVMAIIVFYGHPSIQMSGKKLIQISPLGSPRYFVESAVGGGGRLQR